MIQAPPPPIVRLVLAVSLDGRLAFPSGGPAQLGGDGDRLVLEQALAWADGCLMGAGTLRAHRSTCLIHDPVLLERRAQEQRSPQPIALVVSKGATSTFPLAWPFFQQPLERWLLHAEPVPQPAAPPAGFSRRVVMRATWSQTLAHLAAQGMQRLVLLGGASLAVSCLRDDAVDELQLTLTPRVVGGQHSWVPFTAVGLPPGLATADAWILNGAERLQNDELVVRYQRRVSFRS
ncbi:MAG: RibD family protein [Synechococcus sp.]